MIVAITCKRTHFSTRTTKLDRLKRAIQAFIPIIWSEGLANTALAL
jgi:hypothetical protein